MSNYLLSAQYRQYSKSCEIVRKRSRSKRLGYSKRLFGRRHPISQSMTLLQVPTQNSPHPITERTISDSHFCTIDSKSRNKKQFHHMTSNRSADRLALSASVMHFPISQPSSSTDSSPVSVTAVLASAAAKQYQVTAILPSRRSDMLPELKNVQVQQQQREIIIEKEKGEKCPMCAEAKTKYVKTSCCGKAVCTGCNFRMDLLRYQLGLHGSMGKFSCPLPRCHHLWTVELK